MSKLILSNDTHQILKNFGTINSSIMVRAGNVLKTISVGENSIASSNVKRPSLKRSVSMTCLNSLLV